MANVFFLGIACLQCIPMISNTFGYPTVLIPLSIIVFISGILQIVGIVVIIIVIVTLIIIFMLS